MNLRMRQRQPGGAGVIKGRLGSIGNHPGAIISNNCDFCNCYGQKSYGPGYTNKVPVRARLKASRYAYRAGFGDSGTTGAPRAPCRRFFCARRSSTAGGAGRPSGLPVHQWPVRQPRIIRHLFRLATVSGGSNRNTGATPMSTPIRGEIRPTQSRLRQIAGSVITAGDAVHAISEIPLLDGKATVNRLESVIELLCDAAVELGGIVEGLREVE